jgi:hypothetical protein
MESISFTDMFFGYTKLLKGNPGKGLKISDNEIVVLVGEELCSATLTDQGDDFYDIGCLDPRGWENLEDAAKVIANPTFVDVTRFDFTRDD